MPVGSEDRTGLLNAEPELLAHVVSAGATRATVNSNAPPFPVPVISRGSREPPAITTPSTPVTRRYGLYREERRHQRHARRRQSICRSHWILLVEDHPSPSVSVSYTRRRSPPVSRRAQGRPRGAALWPPCRPPGGASALDAERDRAVIGTAHGPSPAHRPALVDRDSFPTCVPAPGTYPAMSCL